MNAADEDDDPYRELPELYDLEHADFADDIPLYLESIRAVGDPVVEIGCGTGRLLRAIGGAGYRVTGLDPSHAMLDRAKLMIGASLAQFVQLYRGSATDAASAPGGPFGVAIFALDGFSHLASPTAQRGALRSVWAALDPRGQLLIDVLNPTPQLLASFDGGVHFDGSFTDSQGERIDKFSSRRVSVVDQLIHTTIWYDRQSKDGSVGRTSTGFDWRYVHCHELELMLESAGFAAWQMYGGYELEAYDDASERLIVAAEVTR